MERRSQIRKIKSRSLLAILATAMLFQPLLAWADTIYTQDGRIWKGLIVGETAKDLRLDLGFDVASLEKTSIVQIQRSNPKEAAIIQNDLKIKRQRHEKLMRQRDGKPQEIPLVNYNGHALVDLWLENRLRARVLLDTGSTVTFLTANVARQLGLSENNSKKTVEAMTSDGRKQRVTLVTLRKVRLGNIEANDVQAAILPDTGRQMPYIDGLLGMSFLSRYNFKIDYQRNLLILERNHTSASLLSSRALPR